MFFLFPFCQPVFSQTTRKPYKCFREEKYCEFMKRIFNVMCIALVSFSHRDVLLSNKIQMLTGFAEHDLGTKRTPSLLLTALYKKRTVTTDFLILLV